MNESKVEHSDLIRKVQSFIDATQANSLLAKRDRDYYDGKQISAKKLVELDKRNQPPIVNNKISLAVSGLLGILDAGESDPEAYPRHPNHQDAADVVTKTLRYIADRANFKKVRKLTSQSYIIQGSCAAIVEWNDAKKAVTAERIRWEEFIYDPYSIELDFSDARFLGRAKLLDDDTAMRMFPETYSGLGKPADDFDTFFDPDSKRSWWVDPVRKRVRIIELYVQDADENWLRVFFCRSGVLDVCPSPYHDDQGASLCPITATSYEIMNDGSRYGAVRNMIPLQDEVNSRRSKLLHHLNSRQVQQSDAFAPPENKKIAREEAAKPDGTIPFGWEVKPSPDLAQGQMLVLQQSMADLDRMAPTPAVLGRTASANESGRARQILQQAGYTEIARAFGRFEAFEHSIYEAMWMVAREYFTQPQWIRINADPKAPEHLQINEPIMGLVRQPVMGPDGQPAIDPTTGQPQVEVVQGVTGYKNRIAELDMEIVLTTVPDTVTLEQEVFSTLMEYASSNRLSPFDPQFWAMLEMSTLPTKRETIERLRKLKAEADAESAPANQAQAEAQMQSQATEMDREKARATKDYSAARLNEVTAQQKAQEVALKEHNAWMSAYGAPQIQTNPRLG